LYQLFILLSVSYAPVCIQAILSFFCQLLDEVLKLLKIILLLRHDIDEQDV